MRITDRPTSSASLLGGAIVLPEHPCLHDVARPVAPWTGEGGTAGTVTVVGAGKMGLPLAAQFAGHGWSVIAVDTNEAVVSSINEGRAHVDEEPGLAERVALAHGAGRLRATADGAAAASASDVVVLIVPVMLDTEHRPDYRYMDAAASSIAPGLRAGATVIFETTLPVGDTRGRYVPVLEAASGLTTERDLFVAFSPERLFTGDVFRNLATYPKLVGGIGPGSTERAARFYASVLDAEVVAMSSAEAAELSKLADTTYRDVNIAFANELAGYARQVGVDVLEVIRAANSQPYSHIHQPGIGVGGHCIPVYPHFLLSRAPDMELVRTSRRINDAGVDDVVQTLAAELGGCGDVSVLVLGLTYREGVKELAYSRALPLIEGLAHQGARVSAWDPLLSAEEIEGCGAEPWVWGTQSDVRAIVTQTADPAFARLDARWAPNLEVVIDGRNSLREAIYPDGVTVLGIGVPPAWRTARNADDRADRGAGLTRMRLLHVAGTRPQLIKAAALLPEVARQHEVVLVDTGQHWDERLAGAFFAELGLPRPGHSLGVGGGGHASQTARMLVALEPVLSAERPDAVVVYGDTNSTLAGALAAAKLDIPVAHVEAGLRSFDRRMPEEVNRVVADHLATWCYAPTPTAVANLAREGIVDGVIEVGDLMQDLASRVSGTVRTREALARAGTALVEAGAPAGAASLATGGFIFATIHRAENRQPTALSAWPDILGDAARPSRPVILALHPGTRASLEGAGISLPPDVWVVEPLGYRTSLTLQLHAAAVITDSGGIQREAAWLGTPCLVLRTTTEWVEAVATSAGRMVVAGLDRIACAEALERIAPMATAAAIAAERAVGPPIPPAGAARRIADDLAAAGR